MKKNKLIVDSRNVGKTTFLYEKARQYIADGFNVIILDSATEHEDKSLLRKIMSNYANSIWIDNHEESQIATYEELNNGTNLIYHFPYNIIKNNLGKIICFDLSYFLEKGHEAFEKMNDKESYVYYRELYRRMAQQILSTIIALDIKRMIPNTIVITDEIEFPIVDFDITTLQERVMVLSSVHPENKFGTFYQSCEQIEFIPYHERRKL